MDADLDIVLLKPQPIELKQAVVHSSKKHLELVIAQFEKSKSQNGFACSNKPWMIARFFPYQEEYARTPFLKSAKTLTNSSIKNAKFNIRLYAVDEKGAPGKFLYDKNIIVFPKKRKRKTEIDLSKYNIAFPKEGFFIAVEWLIIESNKSESTLIDKRKGHKKRTKVFSYEPSFGTVSSNNYENAWSKSKGRTWTQLIIHPYPIEKNKYLLPAMELVLTN